LQTIDIVVEVDCSQSSRAKQVSCMFDAPPSIKLSRNWKANLPIDERDWQVGLIVGPSGAGKSIVARELFGSEKTDKTHNWIEKSIIDDFDKKYSVKEISQVCSAVGFNTIPSWLKPFHVLSNGEKFRVQLARKLLEEESPIVYDEFTSVVDRQVAKIASDAAQKYIRRSDKKFVAVSCHNDIEDWLQPDWVFRPDTCEFHWRSLQRRPEIEVEIRRCHWSIWKIFAPYHYMSAEINKAAKCYVMFVNKEPVAFNALLPRPISQGKNKGTAIWGMTRGVTLPDWQGIGLMYHFMNHIGAAMKKAGKRVAVYPAHPIWIESISKNKLWKMTRKPCQYKAQSKGSVKFNGDRPCAVFEFCGPIDENTKTDWL
jgi:ABC-type lipoprotein export system ATPase subunit